jgi:uncharacterized protein YndB with AHSA1/START domain
MTPDLIERETTIAAPVERVWSLITESEHVGRWFGDAGAEIDLRPGGAMLMRWKEHGDVRARVENVEPPHRFAYRWLAHHAGRDEEPVEGNSTRVEFTLTPDGDGTRLRVVETGFASLAIDATQREAHHAGNVRGWAAELGDLVEYAKDVAIA